MWTKITKLISIIATWVVGSVIIIMFILFVFQKYDNYMGKIIILDGLACWTTTTSNPTFDRKILKNTESSLDELVSKYGGSKSYFYLRGSRESSGLNTFNVDKYKWIQTELDGDFRLGKTIWNRGCKENACFRDDEWGVQDEYTFFKNNDANYEVYLSYLLTDANDPVKYVQRTINHYCKIKAPKEIFD